MLLLAYELEGPAPACQDVFIASRTNAWKVFYVYCGLFICYCSKIVLCDKSSVYKVVAGFPERPHL